MSSISVLCASRALFSTEAALSALLARLGQLFQGLTNDFLPETMTKVAAAAEARQRGALNFHIEVDGGINAGTATVAAARSIT